MKLPASLSPRQVINTHKGPAWDVEFFTSKRGDVESRILADLASGLKIAVPTDSQQEAEALERSLLANCPAAKVIRIDRKTTQEEFGREFVKDPNGSIRSLKPDVLIYTPSMGSGVSIDEKYFDEVVGLFFGVIEPSEARQMLARVRAPVPRIVWCKDANYDIPGCKSPLPTVVKKQLFKFHSTTSLNLLNLASVLASSDDDADALDALNRLWDRDKQEWNSPHLDLHATVKARRNFGLTQLAVQLHQELVDEGHNVCAFSGESTIFSDAISSAKEEIKQEEAVAIASAEEISIDQAKHILDNPNSKEEERHKARRAVLAESLPGVELSQEFVYKALVADKGRWLAHHRLFWMLHNRERVAVLDNKQWRRHLHKHLVFLPDIHTYSLQVKVLSDIGLPKLIDLNREYCAGDEDVQLTLKRAVFMRHRLKTAFDLNVTENTDAIALLSRLFKRIGLELRLTRRVGPRGQQLRYYSITQTSLLDPDRLVVLNALERKYANLSDEIGSQKSDDCNNTSGVMATGDGSHYSAEFINYQEVMTTKTVEQPAAALPLVVGSTVNCWGWGKAKYIVESLSEFIAEIKSLATGHTLTTFRSMLMPSGTG